LRDIRELRLPIAKLALDAYTEAQSFGRRIGREHHSSHPAARLVVAASPIGDLREPEAREGIARLYPERPAVIVLCSALVERLRAAPGIDQRDFLRAIERIAYGGLELGQRVLLAPVLAEIPAPVVMDVRIVGCELKRLREALLRLAIVAQHRVNEAEDVVGRRVRGIDLHREVELLERSLHLAAF